MAKDYRDVLRFWFRQVTPKQWFGKDENFDVLICQRFGELQQKASKGELAHWRENIEGRLAEIIVLDQFSRNIFRDSPQSFACDAQALCLAQEAVRKGVVKYFDNQQNAFLLMPYMHSESSVVHEDAMLLFEKYAPDNLDYEIKHKKIIDRFGRYPHRNTILGRKSTQEERAFLLEEGPSF